MACKDCNPSSPIAVFPFPVAPCGAPVGEDCCADPVKASCVENDGLPLNCIGSDTKEKLDTILQKIDLKLCEITGGSDPYSDYNTFCLQPVTTAKEFAEKTAAMLCQLRSTVLNFTTSIYPTEITAIRSEISSLNKSNFDYSCPVLDISETDSISDSLYKLASAICSLYDSQIDLSSVDWQKCSAGGSIPDTIAAGFDFILTQLCAINSGGVTLPVFDNSGTCLTNPGITDSLSDTIVKIRTKLCSLPTFSISALTSTCSSFAGVTTLEQTLALMFAQLDQLSKNTIRVVESSQFNISDADVTQPCSGKKISLQGQITGSDRLVAADVSDSEPGTLEEKLAAGTGVSIDKASSPGKLTISVTSTADEKVKSSAADITAGYLDQKISGSTGEINTTVSPAAGKIILSSTIDYNILIDRLFDIIETDADVKARFCAIISSCPSPCAPPTNVQAIPVI